MSNATPARTETDLTAVFRTAAIAAGREQRAEQGLPTKLEDPELIGQAAVLFRSNHRTAERDAG